MKTLNMKQAIKSYNDIMNAIGCEYNMIGDRLSQNTENWNLRDMVSECQFLYNDYNNEDTSNGETKGYDYKGWLSATRRLNNFVIAYKPFIEEMKCIVNHCSCWDNAEG